MTPFATLMRLITRLRKPSVLSKPDTWNDVIKTLPHEREYHQDGSEHGIAQTTPSVSDAARQSSNRSRSQRDGRGDQPNRQHGTDDAYDDRRVPRDPAAVQPAWLHTAKNHQDINASQAALALLFELTLDQAVAIIDALPKTAPTLVNLEIEQRAFMRICSHLKQQHYAQYPAPCLPILTLLARRLGNLNTPAHRDLAMRILAQSLKTLPQIEVIETLSMGLVSLPPELQQRALDQIEEFLWRTADIAQLHVDILLGLTRAVRIEGCRERAGALIAAGLKRLRNEPALCAQIRRHLVLAYCNDAPSLQLQA